MRIGARPGDLAIAIAAGMDDRLLRECGPYDLLIANILAGPLVELAPDFAEAVPPRGHLLLAGLLTTQERKVRAATPRRFMTVSIARHPAVVACWPVPKAWLAGIAKLVTPGSSLGG